MYVSDDPIVLAFIRSFFLADLEHYMPRTLEPLMHIEEGNY